MSPSARADGRTAASDFFDDNLNVSIVGVGVEYPPFHNGPEALEILARRHYPDSPAIQKVLSINRYTGIDKRSAIGDVDHPLVNRADPPSIKELNEFFMLEGVRLSVAACRKAIVEWGGSASAITHVVSTTCTNSANPGYDHFVARELGLPRSVEKILLHGIGCSGGMAAVRTAANLALGATYRKKPARVLVLACEISSLLVRSELESIHRNQEVRIGAALFSDCASACVISNGVGSDATGEYGAMKQQNQCVNGEDDGGDGGGASAVYELLGWRHELLEDTHQDLGFDVDPLGWKVVLTPRVPSLTSVAVLPAFNEMLSSIPSLRRKKSPSPVVNGSVTNGAPSKIHIDGISLQAHPGLNPHVNNGTPLQTREDREDEEEEGEEEYLTPSDFDWALHPGGSTIITGVQSALGLSEDHLRASYMVYMEHGNSSSATILSVLDRLRKEPGEVGGRERVVACAFGPGICMEMIMMKRGKKTITTQMDRTSAIITTASTTTAGGEGSCGPVPMEDLD